MRTSNATKAASLSAAEARNKLLIRIRKEVVAGKCNKEHGCRICTEVKIQKCMSHKKIAENLNYLRIPAVRGGVGRWQVTLVANLFNKENLEETIGLISLFDPRYSP
jgi:hypothetical protein